MNSPSYFAQVHSSKDSSKFANLSSANSRVNTDDILVRQVQPPGSGAIKDSKEREVKGGNLSVAAASVLSRKRGATGDISSNCNKPAAKKSDNRGLVGRSGCQLNAFVSNTSTVTVGNLLSASSEKPSATFRPCKEKKTLPPDKRPIVRQLPALVVSSSVKARVATSNTAAAKVLPVTLISDSLKGGAQSRTVQVTRQTLTTQSSYLAQPILLSRNENSNFNPDLKGLLSTVLSQSTNAKTPRVQHSHPLPVSTQINIAPKPPATVIVANPIGFGKSSWIPTTQVADKRLQDLLISSLTSGALKISTSTLPVTGTLRSISSTKVLLQSSRPTTRLVTIPSQPSGKATVQLSRSQNTSTTSLPGIHTLYAGVTSKNLVVTTAPVYVKSTPVVVSKPSGHRKSIATCTGQDIPLLRLAPVVTSPLPTKNAGLRVTTSQVDPPLLLPALTHVSLVKTVQNVASPNTRLLIHPVRPLLQVVTTVQQTVVPSKQIVSSVVTTCDRLPSIQQLIAKTSKSVSTTISPSTTVVTCAGSAPVISSTVQPSTSVASEPSKPLFQRRLATPLSVITTSSPPLTGPVCVTSSSGTTVGLLRSSSANMDDRTTSEHFRLRDFRDSIIDKSADSFTQLKTRVEQLREETHLRRLRSAISTVSPNTATIQTIAESSGPSEMLSVSRQNHFIAPPGRYYPTDDSNSNALGQSSAFAAGEQHKLFFDDVGTSAMKVLAAAAEEERSLLENSRVPVNDIGVVQYPPSKQISPPLLTRKPRLPGFVELYENAVRNVMNIEPFKANIDRISPPSKPPWHGLFLDGAYQNGHIDSPVASTSTENFNARAHNSLFNGDFSTYAEFLRYGTCAGTKSDDRSPLSTIFPLTSFIKDNKSRESHTFTSRSLAGKSYSKSTKTSEGSSYRGFFSNFLAEPAPSGSYLLPKNKLSPLLQRDFPWVHSAGLYNHLQQTFPSQEDTSADSNQPTSSQYLITRSATVTSEATDASGKNSVDELDLPAEDESSPEVNGKRWKLASKLSTSADDEVSNIMEKILSPTESSKASTGKYTPSQDRRAKSKESLKYRPYSLRRRGSALHSDKRKADFKATHRKRKFILKDFDPKTCTPQECFLDVLGLRRIEKKIATKSKEGLV